MKAAMLRSPAFRPFRRVMSILSANDTVVIMDGKERVVPGATRAIPTYCVVQPSKVDTSQLTPEGESMTNEWLAYCPTNELVLEDDTLQDAAGIKFDVVSSRVWGQVYELVLRQK